MYCPQCATQLEGTATHCPTCNFDTRPIIQLLYPAHQIAARSASIQSRQWKQQRHKLGMLLVMCSLLVGCFIPISIGFFDAFIDVGSLVLVLAGAAGALLIIGTMLILAAEGTILTSEEASESHGETPTHRPPQTGQTHPLLVEDSAGAGLPYNEPVRHR